MTSSRACKGADPMTAPRALGGACARRGAEMARSTRWIRTLVGQVFDEIHASMPNSRALPPGHEVRWGGIGQVAAP